jgi:hypothetical protein
MTRLDPNRALIFEFVLEVARGRGPRFSGAVVARRYDALEAIRQAARDICTVFSPEARVGRDAVRFPGGEVLRFFAAPEPALLMGHFIPWIAIIGHPLPPETRAVLRRANRAQDAFPTTWIEL